MRRHQVAVEAVALTAGTLFLVAFGGCKEGMRRDQGVVPDAGVGGTGQAKSSTVGGAPGRGGDDAGVGGTRQAEGGVGGATGRGDAGIGGSKQVESSTVGGATGGGVAGIGGTRQAGSSGLAGATGSAGGIAGTAGTRGTESSSAGGRTGGAGTSSGCGVLGCGTLVGGAGGNSGTVILTFGKCGDGILNGAEVCDDGNKDNGDGCNSICQVEANWLCTTPGRPCQDLRMCGNGKLTSDETCDDGNLDDGDGCSKDCQRIEEGFECRVPGRRCTPKCGDSRIAGSEICDDGNDKSDDGCSSTCQIEPGADCPEVGKPCKISVCGNSVTEKGEACDCGDGSLAPPAGCSGPNGLFYGDGRGCSRTCTKEPKCIDQSTGATRACDTACGDGHRDSNEECDDGNQTDGDGCSGECRVERNKGFTCSDKFIADASPCQDSANGSDCLRLSMTYRDFQPENAVSGGHPDFFFLGTRFNSSPSPTTICVPNSAGPGRGNDSTKRCWGIVADKLVKGKPQPGATKTCDCQFSDWNMANSSRIPGNYSITGNDSPLSDGQGGYLGPDVGASVATESTAGSWTGTLVKFTESMPGGPVWAGTVPAYKDSASFDQWFNDDDTVNKRFTGVIEMSAVRQLANGSSVYQYASKTQIVNRSLAGVGFFPLDTLNASQATLCNLWPYWNHGSGNPIWSTCTGDQYLLPPRVSAADCVSGDTVADGCWVTSVIGRKHNSYFTDEARYQFVYNKASGIELSFFGDDDLFVFINGTLVLDLGGVHQPLPGKLTVIGEPGNAQITEGGCLDTTGAIIGVTENSTACAPANVNPKPTATSGADFRQRTVSLGLQDGKVYEMAIFGADRHPPESNYQLTLTGSVIRRSDCTPRCGDGLVSVGEECDCGDGGVPLPAACMSKNDDYIYGGCTTKCNFGPYCGDGVVNGSEQCDLGKENGTSPGVCTLGCTRPHYCGDGILDTDRGEECDLGDLNGVKLEDNGQRSDLPTARMRCEKDCRLPIFI